MQDSSPFRIFSHFASLPDDRWFVCLIYIHCSHSIAVQPFYLQAAGCCESLVRSLILNQMARKNAPIHPLRGGAFRWVSFSVVWKKRRRIFNFEETASEELRLFCISSQEVRGTSRTHIPKQRIAFSHWSLHRLCILQSKWVLLSIFLSVCYVFSRFLTRLLFRYSPLKGLPGTGKRGQPEMAHLVC